MRSLKNNNVRTLSEYPNAQQRDNFVGIVGEKSPYKRRYHFSLN